MRSAREAAFDVGPKTTEMFRRMTADARTIFWNGPMGVFETKPFDAGTMAVARILAETPDAFTVVGGARAWRRFTRPVSRRRSRTSRRAAAASLDFLSGKSLAGLEALR